MSAILDYFTAPSDQHAAAALDDLVDVEPDTIDDASGPTPDTLTRPRIRLAANGTPVLQVKGVEPVVALGRLEAVLTGRSYDEVSSGARSGSLVAMSDDGDSLVLTVTDELRDALAALDADGVAAAARAWAIDEDGEPSDESVPLLAAFAELSAGAVDRGERVYCRVLV
ncbi:hypothetical protein [Rhodococcus gannanensis]|uniref:ASCH domain-containing protein n=1 Tax=Rhodococcus gannanensis TaxID=1960308 RepID=A0ABW4PFG1_9NOCA